MGEFLDHLINTFCEMREEGSVFRVEVLGFRAWCSVLRDE